MYFDNNISNIIKNFSKEIDFNSDLIYRIHLITYDKLCEWIGKVNTLNINNQLCFELLLHKSVFDDLQSNNNETVQQAKAIILHELYHCKEMYITSLNTKWKEIYFHQPITTTKLFILNIGYKQWSEYYAYCHSSKIYHRDINLRYHMSRIYSTLEVLHNILKLSGLPDVQMQIKDMTDIETFIHSCIMLVSHYNATHNKKYQRELSYCEKSHTYYEYYPYLIDVASYMNSLYMTFPSWVSESSFIEIGSKLLSFIRIHNLTFSTQDLSDNFILIENY